MVVVAAVVVGAIVVVGAAVFVIGTAAVVGMMSETAKKKPGPKLDTAFS